MPRIIYKTAAGARVSGVTTIISGNLGWNKAALMYWANKVGIEQGVNHYEAVRPATEIGTVAHRMVECDIKGEPFIAPPEMPEEQLKRAEAAYMAYLDWRRHSRLEILHSEVSLVSERWNYGGTLDAIGLLDGKLALLDWKTSNGLYADHLIQIAAYEHLWNECNPSELIDGGIHLLRFGKDEGDFHHHAYTQLDCAWEVFKHLLTLHGMKKQLEALAK